MVRDLALPCGPVVRRVLAPYVQLVRDPFPGEERREPVRGLERAGRVLPGAAADDEHQVDLRAQPVEVVAVQMAET